MNQRSPLDPILRIEIGIVAWAVILALLAAPLGDFAMIIVWPYVLVTAVLVFAYVLEGPPAKRRRRRGTLSHEGIDQQIEDEFDIDPRAQIDEILGLVEHKVTRLEEIERKYGLDVRQKIEEEIRQYEFNHSQEASQ